MRTVELITELSRNTKEVNFVEVYDKPYLQLSVYSILTYADDHGYESYEDILEIKGLETSEMSEIGFEEGVIKKEDVPDTLLEILENEDLYHAFNTEAFLSLMKGEITLEDYYLDDY
jgi:hypothetical protein